MKSRTAWMIDSCTFWNIHMQEQNIRASLEQCSTYALLQTAILELTQQRKFPERRSDDTVETHHGDDACAPRIVFLSLDWWSEKSHVNSDVSACATVWKKWISRIQMFQLLLFLTSSLCKVFLLVCGLRMACHPELQLTLLIHYTILHDCDFCAGYTQLSSIVQCK